MAEAAEDETPVNLLEVYATIGFNGNCIHGLRLHPDGIHIIYPMGNKVTIKNSETMEHTFLSGHTNTISALDVSRSGKYVASGQINHIGFKACVILWDFETRKMIIKHEMHKVRVEAVAFSRKDEYLLSLGGRDCGSVVVWDLELGKPICGMEASKGTQGDATVLYTMNCRGPCFMTAGDGNLAVWKIDADARSVTGTDVSLMKLKRKVLCMDVNARDEIAYAGTSTGDVLKLRLNFHHDPEILDPVKKPMMIGCFSKISTRRLPAGQVQLYEMGVRSIKLLKTGELVVGAGNGAIELAVEIPSYVPKDKAENFAYKLPSKPILKTLKSNNLNSSVTSIIRKDADTLMAGTVSCEVYLVDLKTFAPKLIITCHTSAIYSIAFPYNYSDVFATASQDNIRIWSMRSCEELLRIMVPNFHCSKVIFAHDGKSIVSSWNDGIIRAFTPLTGRLMYAILNAHNKGVSALDINHDGTTLISGGCEGQVRIWDVTPVKQSLVCTLKEHKGPVSDVHINWSNDEAVSASTDGTCIIWDIIRHVRKQIIFESTLFMTVQYYPTGVQILTGGSDRKLCYWEVLDGSLIRELEGSASGAINSLNMNSNGSLFATGGNDQIVKLWQYQEGITTHIGLGHSAVVTNVCFSPDMKKLVSSGGSGDIFIWKIPEDLLPTNEPPPTPPVSGKEENIQNLESSRSCKSPPCKPCRPVKLVSMRPCPKV